MAIPGNFLSETTETIEPNASGWAPLLNCSITQGSGGRVGPRCLLVRATAAGEMRVRTASSYPVKPGTVYEAWADASATTVTERIGIRWLNAAGTQLAITWSLSTMTVQSAWHRISVAAAAPLGASRAQVVLSSTPTAADTISYYENIYLGLPYRTTGNLFGFGTESTEIDASGWVPEVNATLSRQVPAMTWPVDWYYAGGHTLAVTATAAGNAAAVTVDRPTVTPGVEYLAYAYLQPPVLTAQAWIELRFYDAVGNQVGAQRSTLAAPGTGMYRQRASMTAPADAATCGVAAGLNGAAAGQVLRLETVVVTVAPQLVAGSVVPYADASFEQGVAGWTVAAGAATIARTSPWGLGWANSYAMSVAAPAAGASTVRSDRFPVTAGVNWRVQIITRAVTGSWSQVNVRTRWYSADGTDLGASGGASYDLPSTSWVAVFSDATPPPGTTQAAVEITTTAATAGSVLYVDAVSLWQVLPLAEVLVNGDNAYITLTLRELTVGYLLTVYRVTADGARTLVRGPAGLIDQQPITSDILIIEDHEAPLASSVYYRIEIYDSDGDLASTRTTATVTVPLADINTGWLKDPGNPQRNTQVLISKAPDWQRPVEQASYVVRGRRNKVVLSGRRQGLEGDLAVWTRSDAERQALHLLLDSGNTLLWQAAPGMGVDDMYVSVAEVTEARVSPLAQEQWRAWTLPLTEADMPVTTGINGPSGRTWQDVLAEFTTWETVRDTYNTWETVLLDRRAG